MPFFQTMLAAAVVAMPVAATAPAVQAADHAALVRDVRAAILAARMSTGDSSRDFSVVTTDGVRELANDGYRHEDGHIALSALPQGWQVVPARLDARGRADGFRVVLDGVPTSACAALVDGVKDIVGDGEVVVGDLASRPEDIGAARLCKGLAGPRIDRFQIVVE